MAEKRNKPRQWPGLELAIEGEGLSPADISVRHLAELLQAAASAIDAVAEEHGLDAPDLRLTEVREGSAAYKLTSPSPEAPQLISDLYRAAKTRARKNSPKVRHALSRLHHAGKVGSLRIVPTDSNDKASARPILLAPPVEDIGAEIEMRTEAQARVVGVQVGRGNTATVRLRLDRGGTEEFDADHDTAESAARLFNRRVVARVTYILSQDTRTVGKIERIAPWEGADLLDVLREVREEATSEGVSIDVDQWLAELDAAVKD